MHITYVAPAWPPGNAANGIVTYISIIREYLLRHGHDVSVLAGSRIHYSDGRTVDLDPPALETRFWPKLAARLDRRMGHHPFTGHRLATRLRRAGKIVPIDLVEMEESFGWSGTVERGLRMPVVTRLHGPQFLKPEGGGMVATRHARDKERAEGRAIVAATMISAPTRAILQATCNRYGRSPHKARVIPNPVAPPAEDETWRLETCDPDLILFVGRLDRLKGADTMIEAFARVAAEHPTAKLEMVGPDGVMEQDDGSVVPFADHARRTLPAEVMDRITFTGLLGPAAVRARRHRAFLTVVASRCENFPYAAVEALAAGSPLLSTDWVGAGDVIADGRNGWLTPIADARSMAARISWILANPDAAAARGTAAREHCRQVYDIDKVGRRMTAFYQEVLARSAI